MVEPKLTFVDVSARLKLGPHPDDTNQRAVILEFGGVRHAAIGFPNDEGRPHHRLWQRGLSNVHWIGVVEGSELVEAVIQSSAHPSRLTHWVILLKEETVEVVGETLEVKRE